jgi:hypothetical protein
MDRPCPLPNKLAIDTSIPPLVCESFIKAAQLTSNVPIASAWIPDLHKAPTDTRELAAIFGTSYLIESVTGSELIDAPL